jgi:dihydrofolate synthase / folylpolyglutamate synthase
VNQQYTEVVQWLFSKNRSSGIQLGLERMKEACRNLGNPERSFRSIHIAGTNGKGSVCTKIAKAYELCGYATGLYTSPHISSFTERIQANGERITEDEVVEGIATIRKHCSDTLTFFEITTLLAFLWFQKKQVQMAVLETGLGGRLDATNVCSPELCVITSISFDHMNYLGNTIEAIAAEKAGIIKYKTPVVIGPRVPLDIVFREAEKCEAPLFQVKGEWADYDSENSAVAMKALSLLGMPSRVIEEAVRYRPECRFQEVPRGLIEKKYGKSPQAVILDVAHNPDGIQRLLMKAKNSFPNSSLCILLAVSRDKDVREMIDLLRHEASIIICTEAASPRAMPAKMLADMVQAASEEEERGNGNLCSEDQPIQSPGLKPPLLSASRGCLDSKRPQVFEAAQPEEALLLALDCACSHQVPLLVTGTFFFMSSIRCSLGFDDRTDLYDLNSTLHNFWTHLRREGFHSYMNSSEGVINPLPSKFIAL